MTDQERIESLERKATEIFTLLDKVTESIVLISENLRLITKNLGGTKGGERRNEN